MSGGDFFMIPCDLARRADLSALAKLAFAVVAQVPDFERASEVLGRHPSQLRSALSELHDAGLIADDAVDGWAPRRSIQRERNAMTKVLRKTVLRSPLCAYCLTRPACVVDHVMPVARGGRTTIENLRPSCAGCNRAKSDSLPETT